MRPVHVSGVGVVGAFVLEELVRRGRDVTWDDADSSFNAWRASTGAIYPYDATGPAADGYAVWVSELAGGRTNLGHFVERVVHVRGDKVDDRPAWTMFVAAFVRWVREKHASRRAPPEPRSAHVRCRGVLEQWPARPIVVWGWSYPVRAWGELAERPYPARPARPAIHFTPPGRAFDRLYLYPLPGSPTIWQAGSSTVLQTRPKVDAVRASAAWDGFVEGVAERFQGTLHVEPTLKTFPIEGWRPKPRKDHHAVFGDRLVVETAPGIFYVRPLYKSGVQCGPLAALAVAEMIERSK